MGRWGGAGVPPRRVALRPPRSASSPREHGQAQLCVVTSGVVATLTTIPLPTLSTVPKLPVPTTTSATSATPTGRLWVHGGGVGLPAPALPPTYDEPAGRSPWLRGFTCCPGKVPPHPTGRRDRLCSPSPLDPLQVLALGPRSPRPQERPVNSFDLVPEAQQWPVSCAVWPPGGQVFPSPSEQGHIPGRGCWRQGLSHSVSASEGPQPRAMGYWG